MFSSCIFPAGFACAGKAFIYRSQRGPVPALLVRRLV